MISLNINLYMRIVIISQSDSGGAGIAALRLHKALLAANIDSWLLCFQKKCDCENVVVVKRPLFCKIIDTLPLPINNKKYNRTIKKIWLNYECMSCPNSIDYLTNHPLVQAADIINLHWVGSRLSYNKFFKKVKKPIVWTLHDMNPFLGYAHYLSDIQKLSSNRFYDDNLRKQKEQWIHQSDKINVVALCNWMKKHSEKSDALGRYPHYIIPNSIDTTIFRSYSKSAIRELFEIPTDEKVLLFVSQYNNDRKGFDIIAQGIEDLTGCTLMIVGINYEPITTKCKIKDLGRIADQHYMALVYACADAFLLPSREDNLPNTMLESLCCGTPVISTKNGGMADIIQNGENGYIAEEINSTSFRQSIDKFLTEGVSMSNEQISEKAHSMFAPSVQAKGYIDLFKSLLKK